MSMATVKKAFIIVLSTLLCLALVLLVLLISSYIAGFLYIDKNIEYQNDHLNFLKNEYYTDNYIPCDEQKMADFDIEKAKADGVKMNEIAVMGTHNSYQLKATLPKRALMRILQIISFGNVKNKAVFEMDTLTEQLEHGIRNLEIDIETIDNDGDISFIVSHDPIFDNVSSAYDFEKALEEILLWSENNPGHLPVYLLIEPKGEVPAINNMKNFNVDYALELDKLLKNTLGNKLLTPQQAMGKYDTFEQMRKADAWPTLEESSGKIIILLHHCNVTNDYINTDPTIKSQAMFPMLRFNEINKYYASFILENDPSTASTNKEETVSENKLMVRTRADDFDEFSKERYLATEDCGSHIITTDYPPRSVRKNDHTYSFNGKTIKLLK